MKKLRVSLMALALTVGIASAFANQNVHKLRINDPTDTWQDTNSDGSLVIGGTTYADQSAAELATSCTTTVATKCAASVNHPDGTETGLFIYRP